MDKPWLVIIGLGDDGVMGLTDASRDVLARAEIIFGGERHLAHVAPLTSAQTQPWPIPFDIAPVLAHRGRRVVVLASNDPFWFGAGSVLAAHLGAGEWRAIPQPPVFSLAAAHLGWPLETAICRGLHAAPFARLRADLQNGARIICTLRDGDAPRALAQYLAQTGFGASTVHVMEHLGGAQENIRSAQAQTFDLKSISNLVIAAIAVSGNGFSRASGLPDDLFAHDGQITKSPIRALTLSALAPRMGEVLWDIGAGSGSISVEWCLAGGTAHAVETHPDRAANIRQNAGDFGVDHRLNVIQAAAPDGLTNLPKPDAVFIGGGGNAALYGAILPLLPTGTRLIANAVTLETEALLVALQSQHGGSLTKIDIAHAAPLGRMQGWNAARPVVQWAVVL